MMIVMSGFTSWRVLARVSRAFLNAAAWAANGFVPWYFALTSAGKYSSACWYDITQPCGGYASSGLPLSRWAYVSQSSGASERRGVWDVPMPSTISAIVDAPLSANARARDELPGCPG